MDVISLLQKAGNYSGLKQTIRVFFKQVIRIPHQTTKKILIVTLSYLPECTEVLKFLKIPENS
jgi:hypothetical protein